MGISKFWKVLNLWNGYEMGQRTTMILNLSMKLQKIAHILYFEDELWHSINTFIHLQA